MPSPFDNAIAGALTSIRQVDGRSIVYSDGTHQVTIPLAAVSETTYEIDDGERVVETWTSRDYLVAVSDLVLNGAPAVPAKGHTITEVINGATKVFTVMAPKGKQAFEYSDRGQTTFEIHTKETV